MLPERYSLENLRRVAREPGLLRRELFTMAIAANRWWSDLTARLRPGPEAVAVMDRDWDTLIILDACRYDLFAEHATVPGDGSLAAVRSLGSDSLEFMRENFEGRTLHDTVYVTSNPHVYQLEDGIFHAVVNTLETHWDETDRTVPPDAMADAAVTAHERYPNKRLIVHFMQPHFPFLGPTGRTFDHQGLDLHRQDGTGAPNPWYALVHGGPDRDTVLTAYRENLEVVLPHIDRLFEDIAGKTVVTADHGNLVGERGVPIPVRLYGHPRGLHRPELVTVPWYELVRGQRRSVVADPPQETETASEQTVTDRLSALGYA